MKKIIILILLLITPTLVNAETNYLYDNIKEIAETGEFAGEYTGEHQDLFGIESNKKIYYFNRNYEDVLNKTNVIFGGFCWEILRTTDTGGIKLMYNSPAENNKCNTDTFGNIGKSPYNTEYDSLAYIGYMYNPDTAYTIHEESIVSGDILFGNSVEYENGSYELKNPTTMMDINHHYTCNNTSGVCDKVRFYFSNTLYIELTDGKNVEDAIHEMIDSDDVNKVDSTIKGVIDTWYRNYLLDYTKYLEDVIYCNDRSIENLGGWAPNGMQTNNLTFGIQKSLVCPNVTDQFSVNNPKAKLIYPVGMATRRELSLIGTTLRKSNEEYWMLTPTELKNGYPYGEKVLSGGRITNYYYTASYGVRPVISLKPNTRYVSGNGSLDEPYIIDYSDYYKVIIEEPVKKGDIEFEVEDISNLTEGEIVKFRIIPVKGYVLKDLKITDEENNNVDYITNDNINFKFTMPATDVTIKPQYKEIDSNIINPNTKRQLLLIFISIFIIGILTYKYKKKRLT